MVPDQHHEASMESAVAVCELTPTTQECIKLTRKVVSLKDLWAGNVSAEVEARFAILKQHTASFSKRFCGKCVNVVSADISGSCPDCGGGLE